MKLTLSEKINIARRRLRMDQRTFYKGICDQQEGFYIGEYYFYKGICDQQAGSYIEKHYVEGESPRIDRAVAKLKKLYNLEPKDLTIYEIARVARRRRGDSINEAAKKLSHTRHWVMKAEEGKNPADKLYEVYS